MSLHYWYKANPNEVFVDVDHWRAGNRAFTALSVNMRQHRLHIKDVYHYPTNRGHEHIIIVLKHDMEFMQRIALELWLGNDRLRTAFTIMRHAYMIEAADLLTAKQPYYRTPDAFCKCKTLKHKEDKVTSKCPALKHLLGEYRSESFFARTGRVLGDPKMKVKFDWGRVPLNQIRYWRNEKNGG